MTQLRNKDSDISSIFERIFKNEKKNFSTTDKKYWLDNFDEFKSKVNDALWEDNVAYIDVNQMVKWFNLRWAKTIREKLAEEMMKSDKPIVIWVWEIEWRNIFYTGVWNKNNLFEFEWDVDAYNAKSAEILKDIFAKKTVKEWLEFALPIQNIEKLESFSEDYAIEFINDKLKEAWYTKKNISGEFELNDKWKEIKKYVENISTLFREDNNPMSKYMFEVMSIKLINHYDLLKSSLDDISKLKENLKTTTDLNPEDFNKVIKSVKDFENLKNVFASKDIVNRSADKHKAYFNMKEYESQAKKSYDELVRKRETVISNLESQIQELTTKPVLSYEKKINDLQIKELRKDLDNYRWKPLISEKEYIKRFSDSVYKESFNKVFSKKIFKLI